ncbi:hypothetical protein EV651_107346 [Kribbella sp. VKM Ac-2571]|uniref:hypothetical protein n=1 Tax=Kribbella sp. VKM Ac-2571 TaxID=2512222 RepID=UPI00105EBFBE|nr:hypothetical protein [Kribbella sp. VKM Ac-2571]TDO61071.1 hypothetical protein EV651_107346 [Kribbella sp. VKM Ac-2571]
MSGKRDKGTGGNPWVNQTGPDPDETDEAEDQLPPSPWDLEVAPPPSPWGGGGAPGPGPGPGPGSGAEPGPATQTSSAWGDKVGPPSLRRPQPEKKRFSVPPLLIPIGAGLLVVALVAVVLVALSGGDKKADPGRSPSPSAGTPTAPASSYQPPPNALPVGFGVSIVAAPGWVEVTWEKRGKQVAIYPPGTKPSPNADGRAFLWVRQKEKVTANAYLLGIVEGEVDKEIAQLGNVRNLPCPKDVLVECVAIDYTSSFKAADGTETKVKGSVEAYRRKDNVVTALDFRTMADFAPKAEADAAIMKKSVIDSL